MQDARLAETTCQIRLDVQMSLPRFGLPACDHMITMGVDGGGTAQGARGARPRGGESRDSEVPLEEGLECAKVKR